MDVEHCANLTETFQQPYNASINSLIAQLVERRTVNPQVPGSSPGRGARIFELKAQPFFGWAFCIVASSRARENAILAIFSSCLTDLQL